MASRRVLISRITLASFRQKVGLPPPVRGAAMRWTRGSPRRIGPGADDGDLKLVAGGAF